MEESLTQDSLIIKSLFEQFRSRAVFVPRHRRGGRVHTAAAGAFLTVLLIAFSAGKLPAVVIPDHAITGIVVSIHSRSITIRVPGLAGYLRVRVHTYRARKPSSLLGLQPGDKISGVFSRTDGMLHRIRRIQKITDLERKL
jgi:hypothetical protein